MGPGQIGDVERFHRSQQKLQVEFQSGDPLRENDKLILGAKSDSADNVNSTSIILIPVTIRNLKTGIERATFLTAADFGLTGSNVAVSATLFTDVGVYTVNAQEAIKLGHVNGLNSVIYIYGKHA